MKLVINTCYGGYGLSEEALAALGIEDYGDIARYDPRLIELVERDPIAAADDCAELCVVEIPDNATDYYIDEDDGCESVIYVVDGKIHFAYGEEEEEEEED
jgi:hypothetical protein